MIGIDPEDVLWDPGTGMHLADWGPLLAPHDPDAFLRAIAASSRRDARREYREHVAKGRAALAIAKEAKKLGLPVKGATVESVALDFGEPDAAKEAAPSRSLFKARLVPKQKVVL
jgi:hypothetical protein